MEEQTQSGTIQSPGVYKAISAVQKDISGAGVKKTQENKFDHYKFRGIDDVYNALAPVLAKNGLCILPRMLARECIERKTRKGDPLFYVTVDAEFDFVSADDGSTHTVKVFGEAMDRSDKATNKAMSAAYKYACFQTFCIPTEGDNDADSSTPSPAMKNKHEPNNKKMDTNDGTPMKKFLDAVTKLTDEKGMSPEIFDAFMTEEKVKSLNDLKTKDQQVKFYNALKKA